MIAKAEPYFSLGQTVATPRALAALENAGESYQTYLRRHELGNFGDVCEEDKLANQQAIAQGEQILSAYTLGTGVRIWIITEHDRSVTTILLPEEY